MKILGVDSSIPLASIALLENNRIISETYLEDRAGHSDGLLRAVDCVLSQARIHLKDIGGFAITTGPGSFTGLRVGVSLIKGFVLAREIPFKGIDTLEAVSACVEPTSHPICALLDARKKEVYCAFFKYQGNYRKRLTSDRAITPEELCSNISEPTVFIGNGLDTYSEFLQHELGSRFIDGSKTRSRTVAASAAILAKPFLDQNPSMDLDELKITYVRKSEAEIHLQKKQQLEVGNMKINAELLEKITNENEELKKLYEEHTVLNNRVEKLNKMKFLSAEQELEKKKHQKEKLKAKDRLEEILSTFQA